MQLETGDVVARLAFRPGGCVFSLVRMRSPFRWFRRRSEFAMLSARRIELEAEFSRFHGSPVRFVPADAKGGYDQIFYALDGRERLAVVRVNSPHKSEKDPIGPLDPGIPLGPADRLEREWEAYTKLFPAGLSPRPMWRADDCIVCSWIPWKRASEVLVKRRDLTWSVIGRSFAAIRRMHDAGVIHLDLNTGNLLIEENGAGIAIIDFEFGPVDWVTRGQQMAFDYLRLIDDFVKPRRGGRVMLADTGKLAGLLDGHVSPEARGAEMGFAFAKLKRLAEQPALCDAIGAVFPNLRG